MVGRAAHVATLHPSPPSHTQRPFPAFPFPAIFLHRSVSRPFPTPQISEKYGLVYVVTKLGLLFVYDLETATAVYRNRISPDPIFLAANSDSTGGIMAINRCGLE